MAGKDILQDTVGAGTDRNIREFFLQIQNFYQETVLCDLKLIAGSVDVGFNCVTCHALILASAIPNLRQVLQLAFDTSEDNYARLFFPEFYFQDLKNFIDSLYFNLDKKASVSVPIPLSLARVFGLLAGQDLVSEDDNFPSVIKSLADNETDSYLIRTRNHSSKRPLEDLSEEVFDLDDHNHVLEESEEDKNQSMEIKPKTTTSLISLNQSDITPISRKSIEQVIQDQGQLGQYLPYNWSLSEPSLFSSADEYQKLLESFGDSGTVIHALTDTHFDLPSDEFYPNKVKKLVKLPSSRILSLVAIGIRQTGEHSAANILQPIAVQHWPLKVIFDNLLEALLNIAGISQYSFYACDRYYKFKRAVSKPNRVGRALQALKKLSPEQLQAINLKTNEEMKNLEEIRSRIRLSHLPLLPMKMQFSHVSNLALHEITDYAILYGDSISDLKIRSLSHLEVRDFVAEDWIAIFLDLMVEFTELDTPLTLRNQKELYEPFDQLVFRHQAFELLNSPFKKYCIPCRTIFPYATDQEKTDFNLHAQEHNLKKEDSAGLLSCTGSVKCSKLFQSQEALEEHVAKSHDKSVKGDGSYCDTCGKFLPNVHRLKKHHDAHHRQIKCKVCHELFSGTIGLASHRDKVHSQQLPCPHCHKLLPSKVKLEYHMISHMAPEEKKYICEKCGKRFGWSHHLAKHEMNVHVRSRPYKCSVQGCNWAFNDLSNRNMHERRVHKLGPPPKR